MSFFQLIYTSVEAPGLDESEILEILKKSQNKNGSKKISGLLLHRNGRFIQLLEGVENEVLDLFALIAQDSRHREVAVLAEYSADRVAMPTWAMGYCSAGVTDAARRENAFVLTEENARLLCQSLPPHIGAPFLQALEGKSPVTGESQAV